jgi:hypothetical protein
MHIRIEAHPLPRIGIVGKLSLPIVSSELLQLDREGKSSTAEQDYLNIFYWLGIESAQGGLRGFDWVTYLT